MPYNESNIRNAIKRSVKFNLQDGALGIRVPDSVYTDVTILNGSDLIELSIFGNKLIEVKSYSDNENSSFFVKKESNDYVIGKVNNENNAAAALGSSTVYVNFTYNQSGEFPSLSSVSLETTSLDATEIFNFNNFYFINKNIEATNITAETINGGTLNGTELTVNKLTAEKINEGGNGATIEAESSIEAKNLKVTENLTVNATTINFSGPSRILEGVNTLTVDNCNIKNFKCSSVNTNNLKIGSWNIEKTSNTEIVITKTDGEL